MRIRFHHIVSFLICSALPVFAAKPAAKPATPLPSVHLHHLMDTTLPKINGLGPKTAPINRTALIEVQADYVARAQLATPADQPMYQAAVAVMNTLIAAIDEHDKAVANFRYSNSVHGAQDKKDAEVTNAVGNGRANNAKQNKENADSRRALLAKEEFMNKGVIDTWNTRAAQLRAGVEQAYATELVVEKQTVAARSAAVAAVTPPAPPKPKPAKTESSSAELDSPVGTWTSNSAKWEFKTDGTYTNGRGGGGQWEFTNQSKGEMELKWRNGAVRKATFSADGHSLEVGPVNGEPLTLKR